MAYGSEEEIVESLEIGGLAVPEKRGVEVPGISEVTNSLGADGLLQAGREFILLHEVVADRASEQLEFFRSGLLGGGFLRHGEYLLKGACESTGKRVGGTRSENIHS